MEQTASVAKEANRLYWQTERSVGDIAETLGVSRRALYELVTPVNAGASCGNCGGEVVFVNRSAKASSVGRCPSCGVDCEIAFDEQDAEHTDLEESVPPYAAGWPRAVPESERRPMARRTKIGIGVAAGVAVGAVIAYLIVRRRR